MSFRLVRSSALACAAALLLASCTTLPRTPYTATEASASRVLDVDGLRRYTDEPAAKFLADGTISAPVRTYLALSGGGADGAYGAGLLNGWTASGTRPTFAIVSGVSTGAIIAPYAFLGSQYDDTLREIYTSGIAESLLESPKIFQAVFGSGLFGNARLRELVARYVGPELLAQIAREHAKGRRLLVVTTDLDTQRSAIWDMGKIAAIGTPEALKLFRDVIAASASIPLVFPPILIEAEAHGERFQEMHVDGGVMTPVLTLPDAILFQGQRLPNTSRFDIYILVNNKLERDFEVVPNGTLDVTSRSLEAITKAQTRSVVLSTYEFARRNRVGFKLSYISRDYPASGAEGFNTAYMRALYQYGYDKASGGHAWTSTPP
jgi:hypothetical protein